MIYRARKNEIEAVCLTLEGRELAAVSVDGMFKLMPADIFFLFFAEVAPEKEAVETPGPPEFRFRKSPAALAKQVGERKPKPGRPARNEAAPRPSGKPSSQGGLADTGTVMKTGDAVKLAIAERPMMSAEVKDRVCVLMGWPVKDEAARGRIHAAMKHLETTGAAVKRTDPNTQLDHWFLTGGAL